MARGGSRAGLPLRLSFLVCTFLRPSSRPSNCAPQLRPSCFHRCPNVAPRQTQFSYGQAPVVVVVVVVVARGFFAVAVVVVVVARGIFAVAVVAVSAIVSCCLVALSVAVM